MENEKIQVNRTLVGIIALVCLIISLAIFLTLRDEKYWQLWQAAFMRVGLVMAAFWLALPSRHREAAWTNISLGTLVGIILGAIALVRVPLKILLPIAVVIAIIGAVLRPRDKQRPRTRPDRQ